MTGPSLILSAPAVMAGLGTAWLLYYYRPDTGARSLVSGGLLALWPAATSAAPTAGAG